MEESVTRSVYEPIRAEAFEEICAIFPQLREIREQEKSSPESRFEFFLSLLQKLRQINYEPSSEKRYECLFNIIEMGNCLDDLESPQKNHDFFKTIKNYRNVVADGFHAFSAETSDRVVGAYINFLKTLNDQDNLKNFKDSFQRVARGENAYAFIIEGDVEENKNKMVKLLSQMKYFFGKAKEFSEQGRFDAASMAFIGGANCARNLSWFYCEKEKKARGLAKLDLEGCKRLFPDEGNAHIKDLLEEVEWLLEKRGEVFAHQMNNQAKEEAVKFLSERFLASYQDKFVTELFVKLNTYLQREYRAELITVEEGSPRAYEAEKVKKREPLPEAGRRERELERIREATHEERAREERARERERRAERDREERNREREREERRREGRREERRDRRDEREDEERRRERHPEERRRDDGRRDERRHDREDEERRRPRSPGRRY